MKLMFLTLPLFMWWGYKEVQKQVTHPQAMLVLGGSTSRLEREKFTAQFAKNHPTIPIWISGGSPPKTTEGVFRKAGVDTKRLHLDYEAVDTVTNFTTIVDDLQARDIKNVYLITSDAHMRRASVIGEIVLGSRGINFKTVAVPTSQKPEPVQKSVRDGIRAVVWLTTGYTGADEKKNKG